MLATYPRAHITGIILAGGQGSRLGGVDKGLMALAGRPMVTHVIEALRPQVQSILINANRNDDSYRAFGFPVVSDAVAGYQGPLAGMAAGLAQAGTDLVQFAPCDSPFLPTDLGPRLVAALIESGADVAVPVSDGRTQPVFALCRRSALGSLRAFLAGGGRKIDRWFQGVATVEVDFSDEPEAFSNVNTPDDAREAALRAAGADS